jgi:catechol 2,3-dioxygenase-like lactoylglutathione lyase family enzyme
MKLVGLHHFAIPYPVGQEEKARAFFGTLLGLREIPKPDDLQADGGLWYELPDGRQVHLQADSQFAPLRRPHPALLAMDIEAAEQELIAAGVSVRWDERWMGVRRFFLSDPFGNRLEVIDAASVTLASGDHA